jgi:hypothetical protein
MVIAGNPTDQLLHTRNERLAILNSRMEELRPPRG